jgi:hypothetical protein
MAITPPQKRGARIRCTGSTAIIFHGAELLARLHQADFGRERSAGPPGKQQRGDDRPQFAHQTQRHQQAYGLGRTVALQRVVALQPKHKPHEQAGHRDDGQRMVAQEEHLVAHQPEALETGAEQGEEMQQHPGATAPFRQGLARRESHIGRPVPAHGLAPQKS